MTGFWLVILRIVCGIQLVISVFQSFSSLIAFLGGEFIFLLQAIAFGLIALLPAYTFILFGNQFPDKIIDGKQKKNFNRLFLVNFLLIGFLFGFVFRDYRLLQAVARLSSLSLHELPVIYLSGLITSLVMLIFHFVILYGLFWLRNHINFNATRKQFDFERQENR